MLFRSSHTCFRDTRAVRRTRSNAGPKDIAAYFGVFAFYVGTLLYNIIFTFISGGLTII